MVRELLTQVDDHLSMHALVKLQQRLARPALGPILAKVPGATVSAKARAIGASRQAYQRWRDGSARPSIQYARRIAELTGHAVADIIGERGGQ